MEKKNINELTKEERKKFYKKEFEKKSFFEELHDGESSAKVDCKDFYDKFRKQMERLIVKKGLVKKIDFPLEDLHLHLSDEIKAYNFNDGVNKFTTYFYENDKEFEDLYIEFIKSLKNYFDFEFYFQATPTIRFHFPDAQNVDHYPRYHTDIGYGHPVEEINLWINLTEPRGEQKHGFRLMNVEDSLKIYRKYDYDFEPFISDAINSDDLTKECNDKSPEVDTEAGELLIFDSRCIHTGEPLEKHTRISIDVRVIPVEQYNNLPIIYQGAGRRKILFTVGNSYNKLSSGLL